MDFLFDIGYVTNIAVIVLTVGWLATGFMFGFIVGSDRSEKRASKREARLSEYYRSYYNHPSNQR